jgi:hypothetical protein
MEVGMTKAVTGAVKLVGRYADRIRVESEERRISMAGLIGEYAMRGLDIEEDVDGMGGLERRVVATMLAARGDIEAIQATQDTMIAMLDMFVKLMLVHLSEPYGAETEAMQASALQRYDKYIAQVAKSGFDGDRPLAIKKISDLLQVKLDGGLND